MSSQSREQADVEDDDGEGDDRGDARLFRKPPRVGKLRITKRNHKPGGQVCVGEGIDTDESR